MNNILLHTIIASQSPQIQW